MGKGKIEALKGLVVFLYVEGLPKNKRDKKWFHEHIIKCLDSGLPKVLLEDILKELLADEVYIQISTGGKSDTMAS